MTTKRTTTIDENGVVVGTKDFTYTIFDNDKGYLYNSRKFYTKIWQGVRLSDVLESKTDIANMFLLAECLYKDTNMVCITRNKKHIPASIQDMALIMNLCERNAKDFIQRMTDLGIMAKVVVTTKETIQIQYHINPLYFMTSKYLSPALYMMFRKQLDEHLPEWVVRRFNDTGN